MAKKKNLHDVFVNELRDIYNAEQQITKALPKMAEASSASELRHAFQTHLKQTETHVDRLQRAFTMLDEKPSGVRCEGVAGIIEEGEKVIKNGYDGAVCDAALIAAAQRVEHYEAAVYGSLVAWARQMGHDDIAELLTSTLDEEKAADEKLTQIAEGGINETATSASPA